jgi:hypothetical protein
LALKKPDCVVVVRMIHYGVLKWGWISTSEHQQNYVKVIGFQFFGRPMK